MKRAWALAIVSMSVAGCETMSSSSPSPRTETDPPIEISDDKALTALADASLPEKSCGMVLWTLDARRPAPVFRFVVGDSGEIHINRQPFMLTRSHFDGQSAFGVFEEQVFVGPGGVKVQVTVRLGLGFDGGSYLERSLIKVEAANGWRIITPAAGIAGCRGSGA